MTRKTEAMAAAKAVVLDRCRHARRRRLASPPGADLDQGRLLAPRGGLLLELRTP